MKNLKQLLVLILSISLLISCSKNNSYEIEDMNTCPSKNTTLPQILGDWIFVDEATNGNSSLDACDLMATLTITETQFLWNNYSENNCKKLTKIAICYAIENNQVIYFDEFGKVSFNQEIEQLTSTKLILKSVNELNNDVYTETFERP